jgi:hypothetical protein
MASRQRNYTVGERAIRLLGKMAGKTNEEILIALDKNAAQNMKYAGQGKLDRDWAETSLDLLAEHYVPKFREDIDPWGRSWNACLKPPSFSDLSQSGK